VRRSLRTGTASRNSPRTSKTTSSVSSFDACFGLSFYKHNPMTRFINCILFYCKNLVGLPPLIAMIEPCLAKMISLKWCECFKNENEIFWKMSKELGRRDGRVCQEYE
jgi:hypothetical protein